MAQNPELPINSQRPATPRIVSREQLASLQDPSKPANPLISLGESLASHLLNQNAHLSEPLRDSMAAGNYESAAEALGNVQTILEESRVMREKINEAIMGIHDTLGYLPDIRLNIMTQHGISDTVLESASSAALPEGKPPVIDAAPVQIPEVSDTVLEQRNVDSGDQVLSAEPVGFFVQEVASHRTIEEPLETIVNPPVRDLDDSSVSVSPALELDLQAEEVAVSDQNETVLPQDSSLTVEESIPAIDMQTLTSEAEILDSDAESLSFLEQIRAADAELAPPLSELDLGEDLQEAAEATESATAQPTVEIQNDKSDTAGSDSLETDTQAVEAFPAPEAEVIAESVMQTASEVDDIQVESSADAKPEVSEAIEPVQPADEITDEEVQTDRALQIAGLPNALQKVLNAYLQVSKTPATRLEIARLAWPDQEDVSDEVLLARIGVYTSQLKPYLVSSGLEVVALPKTSRKEPGKYYIKQAEGQTEAPLPTQEPDQATVSDREADKQPVITTSGAIIRTVSRDQIADRLQAKSVAGETPAVAAQTPETESNPDQTPRIAGAGSKVQAIYSALWNSTEPISAPDLAEQIWPEVSDPSERIKRLNGQMFNLRKAAEASGTPIKNISKLGPGSVGRYMVEKPQTAATPAEKPEAIPVNPTKAEAAPATVVETAEAQAPAALPVSGELQFDATTIAAPAETAKVQVEQAPEVEKVIPNISQADAWRIADMIEDLSIQEVERLQRNGVNINLPNSFKSQLRQLHTKERRQYSSPYARQELRRTYNEWVEKMQQLVDNPTRTVLEYADKKEIQIALAAITFTIKTPEQLKALLNVRNL